MAALTYNSLSMTLRADCCRRPVQCSGAHALLTHWRRSICYNSSREDFGCQFRNRRLSIIYFRFHEDTAICVKGQTRKWITMNCYLMSNIFVAKKAAMLRWFRSVSVFVIKPYKERKHWVRIIQNVTKDNCFKYSSGTEFGIWIIQLSTTA